MRQPRGIRPDRSEWPWRFLDRSYSIHFLPLGPSFQAPHGGAGSAGRGSGERLLAVRTFCNLRVLLNHVALQLLAITPLEVERLRRLPQRQSSAFWSVSRRPGFWSGFWKCLSWSRRNVALKFAPPRLA